MYTDCTLIFGKKPEIFGKNIVQHKSKQKAPKFRLPLKRKVNKQTDIDTQTQTKNGKKTQTNKQTAIDTKKQANKQSLVE